MSFVIITLFLTLLFIIKTNNRGYYLLFLLQLFSLSTGFLVAREVQFSSFLTFLNLLFSALILYMLIEPWRLAKFRSIIINERQFLGFSRITEIFLSFSLVVNILIFIVVLIFIPDISKLKSEHAFIELYDSIPLFSFFFRFSAITADLAYFSIPIAIYYLSVRKFKKSAKFFILSLTTFFGYLSSYSRAGILTFFLVAVGFILLCITLFDKSIQKRLLKIIKISVLFFLGVFMTITIVRFSAMEYYGDRIPNDSYVKDPIIYNIFDYASQGFYNGINQLEYHKYEDISYGANTLYIFCQILSYFDIIDWSSDDVYSQMEKAYNKNEIIGENDYGSFHGYTCRMVKEFGYLMTLLITYIYHYIVRKKCMKNFICIEDLYILIFLYIQPVICIFYHSIGVVLFPIIYYTLCKCVILLKPSKRHYEKKKYCNRI